MVVFLENIELGHPFLGRATPVGGAALPRYGRPISMLVLFVVLLLCYCLVLFWSVKTEY